MKKTAIVLGATGLTGRYLLDMLLASEDYAKVKVFTRRSTGRQHEKLEEIICDLLCLEDYGDNFVADEVFCCIGTTKAKTKERELYRAIDYGIPFSAARLAERNGIKTYSLISAIGAKADSKVFYSRTKGEMEEAVLGCDIENILIYRPSLIYGEREDRRLGESIAVKLSKFLELFFFGKFERYKSISGKELAKVLYNGVRKYSGHQIIFRNQF
ncbi:putative NAD(P)-binding protein YraR [Globicephala melas]|uniref:putative NAD(P)-binding protein YraR n=1 Tax=Globicephala melas TaxID=9731 RepID=UPI003872C311